MKKLRMVLTALTVLATGGAFAQNYTYTVEDFESSAWASKGTTVTAATGQWTTNKNIQNEEQHYDGTYSLLLSNKNGIVLPQLSEGAGTLIYYAYDKNRQVSVEVSADKQTWTEVESYKESNAGWVKHVVTINDEMVRYLRISTTSNNNFYIDNLVVTKPDGTTGDGQQLVTSLRIPYFIQDFETTSQYPQSKTEAATEQSYQVEGQGEWRYLNAYKATNEAYITDGSAYDLRMLKGGSYVISPLLDQGVVNVEFDEGRSGKTAQIYTSTDGGVTWTLLKEITTQKTNVVTVSEKDVNRIKIANEGSKGDIDVDNITMTAFPEGTVPTVETGDALNIGSSGADVKGTVTSKGDKRMIEWGACWSLKEQPTISDHAVAATADDFTVTLSDMPAATTIYYRAYALSMAGVGYGEVRHFTTADATVASVKTGTVTEDTDATDEQNVYAKLKGEIVDNGGSDVQEVGFCYATTAQPDIDGQHVKAYLNDGAFSASVPLEQLTTYFIRAYAINGVGISYGEQQQFTTGEIVVPDYRHAVFYVSPDGDDTTADGSEEKPFYSLQKAVNKVVAGDTIFMMAGTYHYGSRINVGTIGKKNSGMIALHAKGGRAVLDFSEMALDDNNQGMRISGSYWHIYGLDICGAGDNGMLIERNKPSGGNYAQVKDSTHQAHDNLIENCRFYRNQDTGLQMKNLASYNKVVNCDAFFNADPDNGDADGFAVKISHGDGNYFYGCRAWQNSDDGWDGFIKTDGGFPDDITTTFDECWAFKNGYLENGSASSGNGNGFKLGSDYGRNNVVMNRCMAFENLSKGFDQNHNTGSMILNNCTGYSTKDTSSKSRYTYRLDEAVAAGKEIRLTNCVAIGDGIDDRNKSAYAIHSVKGTLVTTDLNTLPADFQSIDPAEAYADRAADGTLPEMTFMHIADGNTKLIDKGTEVAPYEGESRVSRGIVFAGKAPDLGCFETGVQTAIAQVRIGNYQSRRLTVVPTKNGLVLLTVANAAADDRFTVCAYNAAGAVIGQQIFTGANTAITVPASSGVVLLQVKGKGLAESIKVGY